LSNTKKNAIFKKLLKKENHIYHSRKMLSGTSTDSRKLSCSRATALEQEKTLSQSLCQKAYFPAYDSNSYSFRGSVKRLKRNEGFATNALDLI
jgi:hypothetical protein